MQKLMFIFGAGGLGALARFGLAGVVQRAAGGVFPWGTATVNIAGCFLVGMLFTLAETRIALTGEQRAAVFIGFMGAFTTFSTYLLETGSLIRDGEWLLAAANMAFQNGAGIAALFIGIAAGRMLAG